MTSYADQHVVPVDDTESHECNRQCPCGLQYEDEDGYPAFEGDKMPLVVIHHAYDGRS